MDRPLVSIVIPSYKPEFFEQTLKSALGQTYANCQVIVIDNCPDEQIHQVCMRYPTVIYQRGYFTRGKNVITALYAGAGKYIKPLFDDDILHPFCVEYFVEVLEKNKNIAFIYSDSSIISVKNTKTRVRKRYDDAKKFSGREFLDIIISGPTNQVGELSTIMFSREVLWRVGLNVEYIDDFYFKGLADLVFYINLSFHGDVYYLNEELSYFRRDNESNYVSNSNPAYNPNFGYCFADYFDILRICDQKGLASNIDYANLGIGYYNLVYIVSKQWPQVLESYDRFCSYVKETYNITVGFKDIVDSQLKASLPSVIGMSVLDVFTKGSEYVQQNQLSHAERFYRSWLDENLNAIGRHIVYHALGLVLVSLRKLDSAKECFENAIADNKNFYKSKYSLAEIYLEQNDKTKAKALLESIVNNAQRDEKNQALLDASKKLLGNLSLMY